MKNMKKRIKLIKSREEMGLSQNQVADSIKISRSFYTQIENGTRNPSYDTTLRIAKLLNVDIRNWD